MRFDCSNYEALQNAVHVYGETDKEEALVLVFRTPGNIPHRFIVSQFGIEKQLCGKTGEALDDGVI